MTIIDITQTHPQATETVESALNLQQFGGGASAVSVLPVNSKPTHKAVTLAIRFIGDSLLHLQLYP